MTRENPTKMGAGLHLGAALLELEPVQHALEDPHFSLTRRFIDSSWHHAEFTGVMTGFNPVLHTHFYASESALARWLEDPDALCCDHEVRVRLAKEVMRLAHDYLHSWAYRALADIDPDFKACRPVTRKNIDEQAFTLVLTEAVAVVGLDYWYLCVEDIDERCGVQLGIGPCTVRYRESHLAEYRRYNPALTVQEPHFFHHILRLYALGLLSGFDEKDLQASPSLASWLVRELLISPRQREVSRQWLSRFGGFELNPEELTAPFPPPTESQRQAATQLSTLLWRKIKCGEQLFFRPGAPGEGWRYRPGTEIDFRYANLQRLDGRPIDWNSAPHRSESFGFYVDQYLSRFQLPRRSDAIAAIKQDIDTIKKTFDQRRLEQLAASLEPVGGDQRDAAPFELMFVN